MNEYPFKIAATLIFISLFSFSSQSQERFKFLIPDEAILQHAGSIGFFSAGAGYELFPNKRGNLDFMYGYVPESKGGELHTATIKFAYKPWKIKVGELANIYPFNPGFFLSYTFQKDLSFAFSDDQYPKNYYYWSEALRPHLSVSNEIAFKADRIFKGTRIKTISLYTEFNTNDYYLINYLQNMPALGIDDIFLLGIGLRVKF